MSTSLDNDSQVVYNCYMTASKRVIVSVPTTPEKFKEVRHHVIERNISVGKWILQAIEDKLKQEKESTNATVK